MKIGIIDYDLYKTPRVKRLNADAMKLCNYYQEKGIECTMLSPADDIFTWDKIIFFAEQVAPNWKDQAAFQRHPDISFFGMMYNNGYYKPFDIDVINYGKINQDCYNNLFKYFYKNHIFSLEDIKKIKRKYERIYPNNIPINLNDILTGEKFYLMDNYLYNYTNWEKTMQLLSIFHNTFSFLFPQLIESVEDSEKFKILKQSNLNCVRGIIRPKDIVTFEELIKNNADIMRQTPRMFSIELAFDITNLYTEKFYKNQFITIFQYLDICEQYQIEPYFYYTAHSKFVFTNIMFYLMREWINGYYHDLTFTEIVFSKKCPINTKQFSLFIYKNPELQPLVNKIYKRR